MGGRRRERTRVNLDVIDPSGNVLGTIEPSREREYFLTPPTTLVRVRPTSITDKNYRTDLVRIRYVCR
jgi:hypothetical protein